MKNSSNTPWNRLTAAARRAPVAGSASEAKSIVMPVGFATRVVARAELGGGGGLLSGLVFERFAARALGLAGACALTMAVWGGLPATAEAGAATDAALIAEGYLDPVGSILEAVQP
ncbi:MAG: hypothetical protein RL376_1003 [Verrucomicrobiota bacterium]|jgi:hypothetical protein